jgi:hypothetical protein
MKRAIAILLIALGHLLLAVGLAQYTFEVSGFMFGLYPKLNEGTFHSTLSTAHTMLMFPLGWIADSSHSDMGVLAWPLVFLNSLLWAICIYVLVYRWLPSRKRNRSDEKQGS